MKVKCILIGNGALDFLLEVGKWYDVVEIGNNNNYLINVENKSSIFSTFWFPLDQFDTIEEHRDKILNNIIND